MAWVTEILSEARRNSKTMKTTGLSKQRRSAYTGTGFMAARIINRVQRFLSLPASEKWLIGEAVGFHWAARLGLWLIPFRRLSGWVTGLGRRSHADSTCLLTETAAWAVNASSVLTPRATCLTRSLALQAMLRRRGQQAELRIGVAKPSEKPLEAHAWVVLDGQSYLGGPQVDRFVPMPKLPRSE